MDRGMLGFPRGGRAYPPLPGDGTGADQPIRGLRDGCYLITYRPRHDAFVVYDGPLRVETRTGPPIASGDLYQREVDFETGEPAPGPDPAAGVPILPIPRYRYYLHVTQIAPAGDGFTVAFETYRFTPGGIHLLDGVRTEWPRESTVAARMTAAEAPAGFPSPPSYFTGAVTNDEGTIVGDLSMGFVSPFLRKATIEIDRVPAAEVPLHNGAGVSWKTVFDEVGWELTVLVSDSDVEEPTGESWSGAEGHAVLSARRDRHDLDAEWRYYLLAVRRIDPIGSTDPQRGERGFMFDQTLGDLNHVPREGLMVASRWPIPSTPEWGLVQGQRADQTVTYFRTAVHEVGHAMGLDHNLADNGIMCGTDTVAVRSQEPGSLPFPTNIQWSFASEDAHRLRHWPDMVVRPGGAPMRLVANNAPIDPLPSDRQRLDVSPVLASVRLGAPVRLEVRLVNTSDRKTKMPATIGLVSGNVRGLVVGPSGTRRAFAPLAIDEDGGQELGPGRSVDGSLTLVHGRDGALFPVPGPYRVVVEVEWTIRDMPVFARGEVRLVVAPPVDPAHAEAARAVLTTPETTLALLLGGDHLKDGLAAIALALRADDLRPHFAFGAARRLATRFGTRPPDFVAAAALIDDRTVMSAAELREAQQIVDENAGSPGVEALVTALEAWIAAHGPGARASGGPRAR